MKKRTFNTITYELSCLHEGVTGSAIILNIHFPNGITKQILIDLGEFQEMEYKDYNKSLPFKAQNISYVFLTHTHIDHCGRVPFLVKNGYSNNIYCTNEARELLAPALFDCAKILANEAKLQTKKEKKLILPLYSSDDVKQTLKLTNGMNYNEVYKLDENIQVTFLGNGHMRGAAMILVQLIYPKCETVNLLFTGDYNTYNLFQQVPKIPRWVKDLKLIVIEEATYGDSSSNDVVYNYCDTLLKLVKEKRTVISPVIACERTEQVLLKLKQMQDLNMLSEDIPIFLAGTLACEYFKIYANSSKVDFIPKNLTIVAQKELKLNSSFIADKEIKYMPEIPDSTLESIGAKIILTTSGMADKGKAPYYLSKLVSKSTTTILFTCFLPPGTLGYTLKSLKKGDEFCFNVFGEKITTIVNANVICCNQFSSHAKSEKLLELLSNFNLAGVFINHGNTTIKEIYKNKVMETFDISFVNILDRSIFYSMSGYKCLKASCSKYPSNSYYKNLVRKTRKERKLQSKKRKQKLVKSNKKKVKRFNSAFGR